MTTASETFVNELMTRLSDEEKNEIFYSVLAEKVGSALDAIYDESVNKGTSRIDTEDFLAVRDHILTNYLDDDGFSVPEIFLAGVRAAYDDCESYYYDEILHGDDDDDEQHDSAHDAAHDSAADEEIKVTCYGKTETWKSRADAMAFYFRGMVASSGSERERYTDIYEQLASGIKECHD